MQEQRRIFKEKHIASAYAGRPNNTEGVLDDGSKISAQERMRIVELMSKEGLLDINDCKIAKKKGYLYINDVKQPLSVQDKFGRYFEENSEIALTTKDPHHK